MSEEQRDLCKKMASKFQEDTDYLYTINVRFDGKLTKSR